MAARPARAEHRIVIRNACIHINNEQPLLADLFAMPDPRDLALVCTNLRSMNGSRPVFVDATDSVFVFPYSHIRFVEVPAAAADRPADAAPDRATAARIPHRPESVEAVHSVKVAVPPDGTDAELEIDEDFLRRIREV